MCSPEGQPSSPVDQSSPNGQPNTVCPSISLKRGREGSVAPNVTPIAAKKNRLDDDVSIRGDSVAPEANEGDEETSLGDQGAAKPTVGEVRRKVEEMTWKEGEKTPQDTMASDNEDEAPQVSKASSPEGDDNKVTTETATTTSTADDGDWVTVDRSEVVSVVDETPNEGVSESANESDSNSLKRKAHADTSSVASDEKKRKSTSPIPRPSSAETPVVKAAQVTQPQKTKPQATFGSFSSKVSPFAAVASSSSSPFGAISAQSKGPNALVSTSEDSKAHEPNPSSDKSDAPAQAKSAAAAPAPKKPQATFGAFSSSASPFASATSGSLFGTSRPQPATTSALGTAGARDGSGPLGKTVTSTSSSAFGTYSNAYSQFSKKASEANAEGAKSSTSFGEILKEKGEETKEEKVSLEQQDRYTGEEDEETVYQTRAKLFVMEGQGAWKERGLGNLKINRKKEDGSGARLVMRAEGVFRTILNAALYVGMTCLEDGKHVRMTVFEGAERRFITLRSANPKAASELAHAIQEHTPLESSRSPSTTKSPGPNLAPASDANENDNPNQAEENV